MLLYADPRFLEHETGMHPERADRLRSITARLAEEGLTAGCRMGEVTSASIDELIRIHTAEYVAEVEDFARQRRGYIEADTVVSPRSYEVARLAAGSVCDAVRRVARAEDVNALCLVRPPGHHALANSAMGFCLFNNIAVAARMATKLLEIERVMIVDWDVHHGNGTQDAFWEDERVAFYSIHRWPFYPGTGRADETGGGAGLGTTLNVPTEFGTTRKEYLRTFQTTLQSFADRFRPQIMLVSAGFDSHRLDPIGSLGLEVEDFIELTRTVQQIAATHADGRLISVLEGGYNVDVLAECVAVHLRQLMTPD